MNKYHDVLMARIRRENPGWARFRAAPLSQYRASVIEWRGRLRSGDERPESLDRLRRDLPDCLSDTARDAAAILDARPELAKQVGIDGAGLRDLITRRGDCDKIAAVSAQIGRAAELVTQDAAVVLADHNQRALAGLVAAYQDPATPNDERLRIGEWLAEINGMAELVAHRAGQAALERARSQSEAQRAIDGQGREAALREAVAALLAATTPTRH